MLVTLVSDKRTHPNIYYLTFAIPITAIAKDPEERKVFTLMTIDNTEFEVTTSPPLSDPSPPNKPITNSYNATGLLGHEI